MKQCLLVSYAWSRPAPCRNSDGAATARIEGDTAIVSSDKVPAPITVRYAWAGNPEGADLFNAASLPA